MGGTVRPARSLAAALRAPACLAGLAIVLVAAGLATGCDEQPESRPADYEFDIAVGYVWNEIEGEPLEGVEVWNGSTLSGHSDSTGWYTAPAGFHPVENWQITFAKDGYKSRSFEMPGARVSDPRSPHTYRLDVIMTRGASAQAEPALPAGAGGEL